MTDVLIQELSDADITWMKGVGRSQTLESGATLFQKQSELDALYIILNGSLISTISSDKQSALGRAFSALEDEKDLEQELDRYESGEVVGETVFLNHHVAAATVKAAEKTTVLAVSRQTLIYKLQDDVEFAARFYRATAILLLERFNRLIRQFVHRKGLQIQPVQDGPLIFGELSDSDMDWLIRCGSPQAIAAGSVLLRADRAVESLYVLLQGTFSITNRDDKRSALNKVFAALETEGAVEETPGREIARAARGEIVGEVGLFEARLSKMTVTALEDSLVLAVPRQALMIKLQQDPAMASRFHRMLVLLYSERLQGLINRLGYGKQRYQVGAKLSKDVLYEDEIDLELLDNVTLGGARFDWMLKRLQVGGA